METVFLRGFATSAALIVAIGAQNAFVLRQGLQRAHVLPVVLVCALSDMLLITLGVAGLGRWVQEHPALLALTRWGGAAFLIVYGWLAARRALAPHALAIKGPAVADLRSALAACLAFTYLNPKAVSPARPGGGAATPRRSDRGRRPGRGWPGGSHANARDPPDTDQPGPRACRP